VGLWERRRLTPGRRLSRKRRAWGRKPYATQYREKGDEKNNVFEINPKPGSARKSIEKNLKVGRKRILIERSRQKGPGETAGEGGLFSAKKQTC